MPTAAPAPASLVVEAAAPFVALTRAAAHTPLATPTPCAGWDLRALVNHLLYWAPVLAATGRRGDPAPPAPTEDDVDLVTDGWPGRLVAATADIAQAWSVPIAWEGTVAMDGPEPLPAAVIGGMALVELVVHGWDVARTVGVDVTWPPDVAEAALGAVRGMGEQGRAMGLFAPEVPVPADAPPLHRVVGAAGRDPGWTR